VGVFAYRRPTALVSLAAATLCAVGCGQGLQWGGSGAVPIETAAFRGTNGETAVPRAYYRSEAAIAREEAPSAPDLPAGFAEAEEAARTTGLGDDVPDAPGADGRARPAAAPAQPQSAPPQPSQPQPNQPQPQPNRPQPTPTVPAARSTDAEEPAVVEEARWLVDGLVGQINGRPVFADEFLQPIEAKLQEFAALADRQRGRNEMLFLVSERFQDWVNSELIISEAESQLTPEQQEGLFAWLRSIQEAEIAERGGNVAAARASLEEDLGMGIEEFVEQRRDQALARYLIDRKVTPRTIVSWRDIEREYRRRFEEFNPPPRVAVARIAVRDEAEVARVRSMLAEGRSFADVALALGAENRGVVAQVPIAPGQSVADAIEADKNLVPAIKNVVRSLPVGGVSEPVSDGRRTAWFALLPIEQGAPRDLFDADVQLLLKNELNNRRAAIERGRYLERLRSRWVTDDIARIEQRLMTIAMNRYWQ
jgi:hypothetical protein